MCELFDKNISNEKYEKVRNCLFKMKNGIKLNGAPSLVFNE